MRHGPFRGIAAPSVRRRIALLAGLLAFGLPTIVSAQLDTLFRNFLQNVAPPTGQPPPTYYPPPGPYRAYPPPPPAYAQPQRPAPLPAADRASAAEMQRMLDDLGYDAGPADGAWGERSVQALRAFERDHGQRLDGEITPVSQAAVRSAWYGRGQPTTSTAAAPAPRAGTPSFDCARAASPVELAICRDPELAELDRDLAQAFAQAQAAETGDAAASVLAEQRTWVTRRNACGARIVCLRQAMAGRLAELRQPSPVATSAIPDPPAVALPAPNARNAAQPAASAARQGDPLERLVHPPADLRPWSFETLEGRLAVTYLNRRPSGSDKLDVYIANDFFHLLAAGTLPGYLDDAKAPTSVAGFLSDEAIKTVFAGGSTPGYNGWAGANEFERDRSRHAFQSRYAPLLRDLAPKPPFELRWIEPAMIEPYDAVRGGFRVRPLLGTSFASGDQLKLLGVIEGAGLDPAPGFTLPDFFWPVDKEAAEAALRRLPDRKGELAAVVEVASIDPDTKEITLRLRRLSLYAPDRSAKLYDFPIGPDGAASPPAQAPADQATSALPAGTAGSQDEAALANGRDAAQRWALRTLDGLPLLRLGSMSDLRGGTYADYTRVQRENLGRALGALALTAVPSAFSSLTDPTMREFACSLLAPRRQAELFGEGCRGGGNLVPLGQEFALRDAVAAFRTTDVPALVRAAPRLPLEVLLQIPIRLDPWDPQRGAFRVASPDLGASLLGSPLPMAMPRYWQAPEPEARAFVAAAPRRGSNAIYEAVLSVPVTITGVTPGSASPGGGATYVSEQTGLPANGRWRFAIGDATLYADAGQTRVLHKYGRSLAFPIPSAGTPAAEAPRPSGPVPLNAETALVILQRPGSPDLGALNWRQAARDRRSTEDYLRQNPGWNRTDAWGIYFARDPMDAVADPSDAEVAGYRAWTARRGAAMPDSVVIRQSVPAGDGPRVIKVFARQTGSSWIGPPPQGYPQALRALGVSEAQILPVELAVPGGGGDLRVLLAVPKAWSSYTLDAADGVPAPPQTGRADPDLPTLKAKVAIAGVEEVAPDAPAGRRRTILMRLDPIAATVRSADSIVASAIFPRSAWPPPPTPPAPPKSAAATTPPPPPPRPDPEQRFAAGPYGPDMLGIRIGTPTAEAESLIRAHMHVARVLETEPPPPGAPAELRGKLFVADDRATSYFSEEIAIYEAPPPQSGKVVAAWRTLYVNDGMWDRILRGLTEKYGAPSRALSRPGQPAWGDGELSFCISARTGREPRWFENGQPLPRRPDAGVRIVSTPLPPLGNEPRDRYESCGPTITAHGDGGESMADGRPLFSFTTSLFDIALLARLSARWAAEPLPAGTAEIKY